MDFLRELLLKVLAKGIMRFLERILGPEEIRPQLEAEIPEAKPSPEEEKPLDYRPESTPSFTDPEEVTILVADDEPAVREILEVRLEREEFTVITANDGNEAFRVIRSENPDLAILNWRMPYFSGFRILKEVRKQSGSSELPVFMMVERGNSDDQVAALSAGANDCIEKPINFDVTLARIGTQLDLLHQHDRIRSLVQFDPSTRLFNRDFLRERLDVELERVERHGGILTVMVIEIQSETGEVPEESIQTVAEHLQDTLRQMDVLGRLEASRFGVLLPETNEEETSVALRRIRTVLGEESLTTKFTFAFGTTSTDSGDWTPEEVFQQAIQDLPGPNQDTGEMSS